EGTNFYRTRYGYDHMGRPDKEVTPNETINRTVYDSRGRVWQTWVGTDDTPTSGWWAPPNTSGHKLVKTSGNVYDRAGDVRAGGDGNLTRVTLIPNSLDASTNRVTDYYYDWRDRLVVEKQGVQGTESGDVNRPIFYTQYDNLDEPTLWQRYDG